MRARMTHPAVGVVVAFALLAFLAASARLDETRAQDTNAQGTPAASAQLPKPDPAFTGKIGGTYKDSTPDYPLPAKAPQGAPNVLLILLDDVGFGMCSPFGG